jgi:hypothetical protein
MFNNVPINYPLVTDVITEAKEPAIIFPKMASRNKLKVSPFVFTGELVKFFCTLSVKKDGFIIKIMMSNKTQLIIMPITVTMCPPPSIYIFVALPDGALYVSIKKIIEARKKILPIYNSQLAAKVSLSIKINTGIK